MTPTAGLLDRIVHLLRDVLTTAVTVEPNHLITFLRDCLVVNLSLERHKSHGTQARHRVLTYNLFI
jgi:hypothetical protein